MFYSNTMELYFIKRLYAAMKTFFSGCYLPTTAEGNVIE